MAVSKPRRSSASRSRSRCCVVVLLLVALLTASSSSSAAAQEEIVALTDDTFEHQTQASTGMTTGSWLVLFTLPNCKSCESVRPVLEELGRDEEAVERGVVLASVDCAKEEGVCLRFSVSKLPVLLYLHKKRMYAYPLKDEEFEKLATPDVDALKSFVLDPSMAVVGEPIPDPPSALSAVMKQLWMIHEHNPWAGYAIFGMTGIILFTVVLLVVGLATGAGGAGGTKVRKSKSKSTKKNQ
eukprot:CAMPEP_0197177696 /NCGR_PEP_ID=MMETSP1423-20130617/3216_1 /TAXON_ID=476441 /ORGANISM="Pseudo-nitzschia heimii, Strain UNC1101" /LENGTH=239 /DNA_ID=CAMNT_0042627289 /DNA_START=85 /DNA_END=804 /DNA_ORIENTATION=+